MKKLSFAIVAFLGLSVGAMAQNFHDVTITIPSVTLIAVKNAGTLAVTYTAPTTAGDPLQGPTVTPASSPMYLQFSSIATGAITRKITATATSASTLTNGLSLKVSAGTVATGGGNFGTSMTNVSILSTAQALATGAKVIDGITSCYTGTGGTDGSLLTYAPVAASASVLTSAEYAALRAGTYTVTVTYTLADDI
jgi:hypothetical protein